VSTIETLKAVEKISDRLKFERKGQLAFFFRPPPSIRLKATKTLQQVRDVQFDLNLELCLYGQVHATLEETEALVGQEQGKLQRLQVELTNSKTETERRLAEKDEEMENIRSDTKFKA